MKPFPFPDLCDVPSTVLAQRLYDLRNEERGLLVEFLVKLAVIDSRRFYLEMGFNSCFALLTDHLGYTKSSAYRRSTAARLLARFPVIGAYLADGRLGLTTLVELRDVLEDERLVEILDRAAGRTEDQVKELVAALRPRPAPMDLLRRLPEPRPARAVDGSGPERLTAPAAPPPPEPPPAPPPPPRPAARVEPISEELRVLRVTVGRDFVADLEAVKAALSHQIPDGNLARVLHECLRRTLRDTQRRRAGAHASGKPSRARTDGRYLSPAIRREVWRRDDGRCTFVGADGHRCGSTFQLQFHHLQPFAKGGPTVAANLTLHCSRHNAYRAEQDFGQLSFA